MKMQATGCRRLFHAACAASLACAQPAPAQQAAAPVTVGGWTIRDLRGVCSAETRQGGLSAEVVHQAGGNTTLLLRDPAWSALRERHGDAARLSFSNGRNHDGTARAGRRTGEGNDRVTTVSVSSGGADLLSDFARAHRAEIAIGGASAGTLSLRGTSAVAERLRLCAAESFRRHPQPMPVRPPPPAAQAPGPTPPVHSSGSIGYVDYPASALRAEEQGTVAMRLEVNEDGRVTDCTITGSSGSSTLDSASCSLAQRRFRFHPARDANGNSVPGTVTRAIRWSLPSAAPEPQPQAPIPPK
jgi:TonB family protein